MPASQLENWVFNPQPLSELPKRSLGKSVHFNLPGKKHNSGFGLPPIAVTKIYQKRFRLRVWPVTGNKTQHWFCKFCTFVPFKNAHPTTSCAMSVLSVELSNARLKNAALAISFSNCIKSWSEMISTLLIKVESETCSFIIYLMMSYLFTQKVMLSTVNKCRFQKLSSGKSIGFCNILGDFRWGLPHEAQAYHYFSMRLIITFQWGWSLLLDAADHCFSTKLQNIYWWAWNPLSDVWSFSRCHCQAERNLYSNSGWRCSQWRCRFARLGQ